MSPKLTVRPGDANYRESDLKIAHLTFWEVPCQKLIISSLFLSRNITALQSVESTLLETTSLIMSSKDQNQEKEKPEDQKVNEKICKKRKSKRCHWPWFDPIRPRPRHSSSSSESGSEDDKKCLRSAKRIKKKCKKQNNWLLWQSHFQNLIIKSLF